MGRTSFKVGVVVIPRFGDVWLHLIPLLLISLGLPTDEIQESSVLSESIYQVPDLHHNSEMFELSTSKAPGAVPRYS
ncbi:hypothetical protein BD779DRAFT_1578809 [Infundibulicybe gibba]|nr:hypothetical protein BD779DRAFT_1578809 [Infundibulicybe gibba]